jgi:hypothetical protein
MRAVYQNCIARPLVLTMEFSVGIADISRSLCFGTKNKRHERVVTDE